MIFLTCYSISDLFESLEFIVSEFEYGKMKHYILYDSEVIYKTLFEITFPYETDEEITISKNISIGGNAIRIKADSYDEAKELVNIVREIYFSDIPKDEANEDENIEDEPEESEEDEEGDYFPERIMFSSIFLWATSKLGGYL